MDSPRRGEGMRTKWSAQPKPDVLVRKNQSFYSVVLFIHANQFSIGKKLEDMTLEGRIWFESNPWKNGHSIKSAELFIELSEGGEHAWPPTEGAYLGLKISSDNYYSDMSIEEQERAYEKEAISSDNDIHIADWNSFIVWQNFGRCRVESSNAQIGSASQRYDLTNLMQGRLEFEKGRKIVADQENDLNAFTCYILGHDSVADHDISFSESIDSPGHFDIKWTGAIALSYIGDYNFEHRFRVELNNVPFLGIKGPRYQELREVRKSFFGLFGRSEYYDLRQDKNANSREKLLRKLAEKCLKLEQNRFEFQSKERCDWLVPSQGIN